MTRAIIIFVASGAYSGFVPAAPGTAGSIVGLALARAALPWARAHWLAASAVFAVLFAGGCWGGERAPQIFRQPGSPRVVLGGSMGLLVPIFFNPLDWIHLLIGFVLFRLFDIVKVPPASFFDRNLRGGSGVMLDDLAAAVYANIALRLVAHLIV